MNKADEILISNIVDLLNSNDTDESENVRPHYIDGTPAHTRYITQVCENYDLSKNEFPITTLRPISWKSGIKEILWIYQDQTSNLKVLEDKYGIKWWNDWNIGNGTIGQRYGATVKKYGLIGGLISGIKTNPMSRRHIIDLWQYNDFRETDGLQPCAFQTLWTIRGRYLDCTLVMRSSDYLVAGHVNRIQYVALQMMIAKTTGYEIGKFTILTQNLHIYDRHIEQAVEMLKREPSNKTPILKFNPKSDIFYDFTIDDFEMVDYEPVKPNLVFELGI